MSRLFNPKHWVGWMPNGIGQVKPNHFFEMLRVLWRNKGQLPYAYRILDKGVCDGCALGTTGMRDFTLKGIHLCTTRLNLLRINTMPALDIAMLDDVAPLLSKETAELREMGRLPYPMRRKKGEKGFHRISWNEAYDAIAARIKASTPKRIAFYLTSRGLTNEVYYVAQKAARFLGTNNVDNAARTCHSPSSVALKSTLGVAASTCSYKDWLETDMLVFVGSNTPNNQPVTTKYMYYAKQNGAKIVVINPYREPGLERYWVPSVFESAIFGTKLADTFFEIHTGGDMAFLNGTLKCLIEMNAVDDEYITKNTVGWPELKAHLAEQTWEMLEKYSGTTRAEMQRFADMYAKTKSAIFVWSMGITQHVYGVDNVKAIVNLALARGNVGRLKTGVVPIRGHSGVQGGGEMGAAPSSLPGVAMKDEELEKFSQMWGFDVPSAKGLNAVEMIDAAHAGELDVFFIAGGNFLDTLPDPAYIKSALEKVPLRVHQDIVLTPQMLIDPADDVILLPACTRYEQRGGGTETSTERYVIFSPEIEGRRIGEARAEWEIFMELAERVHPERKAQIHYKDCAQIRDEIAKAVPFYAGIEKLKKVGDAFQYGGRLLCENGNFPTPDGKGHFTTLTPPETSIPAGKFFLSTRRGKQFNSIVYDKRDPLTGAGRDAILISPHDGAALGLKDGDAVLVKSSAGQMRGHIKLMPIKPGNLQAHWPEANVLIKRGCCEPASHVPDYNAMVEVLKA